MVFREECKLLRLPYWNFPYYKGVSSYDAEGYVNHNLWRFVRTVMGETWNLRQRNHPLSGFDSSLLINKVLWKKDLEQISKHKMSLLWDRALACFYKEHAVVKAIQDGFTDDNNQTLLKRFQYPS